MNTSDPRILYVLVHSGCYSGICRQGGLEKTEMCFSPFWRLEVRDQGVSKVGSREGPVFLSSRYFPNDTFALNIFAANTFTP